MTRGYLIPSSKLIKRRGKVYGLVLNEDKECVGHKILEVKEKGGSRLRLPTGVPFSAEDMLLENGRPAMAARGRRN